MGDNRTAATYAKRGTEILMRTIPVAIFLTVCNRCFCRIGNCSVPAG